MSTRSSSEFLYQLPSTLRLPAGHLQQGFPECMPAFLLTRFCPLQAAQVLVFLLKVSAKSGHPGTPVICIVIIGPEGGKIKTDTFSVLFFPRKLTNYFNRIVMIAPISWSHKHPKAAIRQGCLRNSKIRTPFEF